MLYIYDILLNFNSDNKMYDFFDWDLNDNIEHIKKIPLFRVSRKTLNDINNNIFTIDKSFLIRIKNYTEVYRNKRIEKIPYCVIFTDSNKALAVEFNYDGLSIHKSALLLDEEEEVIDVSFKLGEIGLNYKIDKKLKPNPFLTRNDEQVMDFLKKEILDTYKRKDLDKLKYMYMEYFDKVAEAEVEDVENIYIDLCNSFKSGINDRHNMMYNLLKLSYTGK